MRSVLALAIVLALLFASRSPGADVDRAITGRIVDADGHPVAATVQLRFPSNARSGVDRQLLASVITDAEGRFLLTAPAGGSRLAIGALVDGRPCWWRTTVLPGWDCGEIRIDPRRVLSGIVRHGDQPVGGALIQVRRGDGSSHFDEPHLVRSDGDGRFTVTGLTPGPWCVAVADERWSPTVQALRIGADAATVALEVSPAAVVSGIVRDASGAPVPGAVVRVLHGRRTTTDGQGAWSIGGLASGPISLLAGAFGLAVADDTPIRVDVHAGTVANRDITLVAAGSVDLLINRQDGGAPPPSVLVDQGTSLAVVPVVAGVATVRDLVPGPRRMTITAAGLAPGTVTATVASGRTVRTVVPLVAAQVITGRVCDEAGQPLAEAMVGVLDLAEHGRWGFDPSKDYSYARHCDADGTFRIVDVPPGPYGLIASAPGHALRVRQIEVGDGLSRSQSHEFHLGSATKLAIQVQDGDGRAVPDARIGIWEGAPLAFKIRSDDAGMAYIDGVLPVKCQVQVSAEGFLQYNNFYQVAATADAQMTVILDRGRPITRRLCDHRGAPVAGAWITMGDIQWTQTDAEGRFTLADVAHTRPHLNAEVLIRDRGVHVWFKDPPMPDGELRLPRLVAIPVRLSGPDLPASDSVEMKASADPETLEAASGVSFYQASLSRTAAGAAVLVLMGGARYRVAVRGDGAGVRRTETGLDLSGPEATWPDHVDLALQRGATVTGTVIDADGQPASGFRVLDATEIESAWGEWWRTEPSHADGAFRLTGLAPGMRRIVVRQREEWKGALSSQDILIPDVGDPPPLTLRLPPLASVAVHLEPPSSSSRPARILLRGPLPRDDRLWSACDTEGTARFPGIPAGAYSVAVEDRSYRGAGMIAVAGREVMQVTLTASGQAQGASISGTIPSADGWSAVMAVVAVPLLAQAWSHDEKLGWRGMSEGSVEGGGGFHLTGLAEGSWRLNWMDAKGGIVWSEIRTLAQDEQVVIAPGADGFVHHVSVTGPDGLPMAGVRIRASPTDVEPAWQEALSRSATTEADGTAAIGLLTPGKWRLSCVGADSKTVQVVVPLTPASHTSVRIGADPE